VRFTNLENHFTSNRTIEDHYHNFELEDDLFYSWRFERTGIYDLNQMGLINPVTSTPYRFKESSNLLIGFVNGFATNKKTFDEGLLYIGQLADHNVIGVHYPDYGISCNIMRYLAGRCFRWASETTMNMRKVCDTFFTQCPHGRICWVNHSGSGVDVNNLVRSYPPHLRKRIRFISVASAQCIDRNLCEDVIHLVSGGDIVPYIDISGLDRNTATVRYLKRAVGADWRDHGLMSPTFAPEIRKELKKVQELYGDD
jgi:hypothetical protein